MSHTNGCEHVNCYVANPHDHPVPLTPSDQHSAEAEAFAREYLGMADDEPNDATGAMTAAEFIGLVMSYDKFHAARVSVPVSTITDRERLARILAEFDYPSNPHGIPFDRITVQLRLADAILADPGVRLTGVREEIEKLVDSDEFWDDGNGYPWFDQEAFVAALFDRKIIHDASEVEAAERQRAVTIGATLWPSDSDEFDRFAEAVYGDDSPSVPLVSTREAVFEVLHKALTTRGLARVATDALFAASGVLVDRGESDAQALEAAANEMRVALDPPPVVQIAWLRRRATRLRSGKAEA